MTHHSAGQGDSVVILSAAKEVVVLEVVEPVVADAVEWTAITFLHCIAAVADAYVALVGAAVDSAHSSGVS